MGLLESVFHKTVNDDGFKPDFENGLILTEFVNGKLQANTSIQLAGPYMPEVPFEFGGKQNIVKDFYPGNPEPVLQILGAQENDVTIRGKFKTNRLKTPSNRHGSSPALLQSATEYQKALDQMRQRGNLVQIQLGDFWKRYVVISESSFKLIRLTEIEYALTFSIIGETPPKNWKMVTGDTDITANVIEISKALSDAVSNSKNYPAQMPRSLHDIITSAISSVADVIHVATSLADSVMTNSENIAASANRAIGVIRYARTSISQMCRRIGAIPLSFQNLTQGVSSASSKVSTLFDNAAYIKQVTHDYSTISMLLAKMEARFKILGLTIPLGRYLIKQGDTLQNISVKYYNTPANWKAIYDHNKLNSNVLAVGSVLEIPKL